ncbi:MAG: methylenetetrahydrofolate reductase [Pseudolabrys sp.]|nr:methylenetetrahydrofolate reductase [Pseudolabrys sp.]
MSAFAASFSIEATRPSEPEIAALADVLAPRTAVYLSAVPAMALDELVTLAASLRRVGLDPVAHIAARRLSSISQLHELLRALRSEADMRQLLVIGGDVDATGPFPDALSVIQKGGLRDLGFEEIGIAGYPEGHARIPAGRLEGALDEKIASATAQGLRVHIVSQFSFSPERVLAWLRQLRASGLAVPVKVGMAGPTSVPALLRYAKRCGVAASLRGMVSGVGAGLIGHVGPGRMIEALAAADNLGDIAPHYFSFGGVVETARFACDAARGTHSFSHAMAPNNA